MRDYIAKDQDLQSSHTVYLLPAIIARNPLQIAGPSDAILANAALGRNGCGARRWSSPCLRITQGVSWLTQRRPTLV